MVKNNPFTQFGGHLETLGVELHKELEPWGLTVVDAVASLVQPGNAWAISEIGTILKKLANVFRVKIGGRRTIQEVVEGSGYNHFDYSILDRCALSGGRERWVTIEVFGIEHFDHDPTDVEIEAEYVRRSLRRPDVDHVVHFGDQVRVLPVEGHPVVFYLKNPVPGADGGPGVLRLWRHGAGRKLHWSWPAPGYRWDRRYRFAGVREQPLGLGD